jgi:hypothetical protein
MLRSLLRFTLLAALVLAASAHAAPEKPAENLLLNPGFEETRGGLTVAWDSTDAGMPTVFFGRDSLERHEGASSVYVANISTAIPMWHNWSQTVLIEPSLWGKDVVLTVWTKSNGVSGRAYVLLQCFKDTVGAYAKSHEITRDEAEMRMGMPKTWDPIVSVDWRRLYFTEESTEWVKREVRAHVPRRTNVITARLGIFGTGQVFFDDATLTAVPARRPPPLPMRTNLLRDPSFEGDGNLWEYSMPPYSGLRVEIDTTTGRTGRHSARFSQGATGLIHARAGVAQAVHHPDLGGKRFRAGGWCKLDSLKGITYMRTYSHSPDTVRLGPMFGRFSFSQGWTKAEEEFETLPGTVELWVWAVYNVPADGIVWWDDLYLEYLGPAKETKGASRGPAKSGSPPTGGPP